ncbi:unnamed protein product, partial [Durusdinium trenchii]
MTHSQMGPLDSAGDAGQRTSQTLPRLRTPQLATALAGDSILEEVCLSQEALLLLWQAEKCGLASRHWVVDALRAFAAEEEPAQCLLFTLARLKAISRAPGAPANSAEDEDFPAEVELAALLGPCDPEAVQAFEARSATRKGARSVGGEVSKAG